MDGITKTYSFGEVVEYITATRKKTSQETARRLITLAVYGGEDRKLDDLGRLTVKTIEPSLVAGEHYVMASDGAIRFTEAGRNKVSPIDDNRGDVMARVFVVAEIDDDVRSIAADLEPDVCIVEARNGVFYNTLPFLTYCPDKIGGMDLAVYVAQDGGAALQDLLMKRNLTVHYAHNIEIPGRPQELSKLSKVDSQDESEDED